MIPEQIGRYTIISELGRGGMATVYQGHDPRFEREVAIKILPHTLLHSPQFRARFEREAKTIATLEHPAIVPVYDFGEEDGQPYIVMQLMPGGSLSKKLEAGPLDVTMATGIISRLAPALDAAHKKGIIHRDLKPDNILFDQYDNAYISDFGIARLREASETLTGSAVIGTPAYMSPEQVQAQKELDGRSDIYSLGIILYQMLTGEIPFQANTPAKLMMMHLLEPVPHLLDTKPDIKPVFDDVVTKSLAKQPGERYPSAGEMAYALESAATGERQPPPIPPIVDETYIAATRVLPDSDSYGSPLYDEGSTIRPGTPDQQSYFPPAQELYSSTPPPTTPPPMQVSTSLPLSQPTKKSSRLFRNVGILGAIAACGIIGILTILGLSGQFSNNSSSSPAELTSVALSVKATRDVRSQGTQQAKEDEVSDIIKQGREIVALTGCIACHTDDGSNSLGPTWKGMFGSEVTLDGGNKITADEDFLRIGILNPNAQQFSGFQRNIMPSDYGERLSPEDIDKIIAYLRSIGN